MKKITLVLAVIVGLAGCDSLRFAPGQTQKQNAWLHNRTATAAAQTAKSGGTSEKLKALCKLSELQSRAFVADYGVPKQLPMAESADEILAGSNVKLAEDAIAESSERPDAWDVADNTLELAVGICGLLGGVYGTRAVRFLKDARGKSKALKEIVQGNELFKQANRQQADAFKQAHRNQSPATRQLVSQAKAS